ncbi:hypothetical protein OG339_01665 [Streptosporangium sp. NBC_01495]|uniref:hypothetical protein n=1 Tax=Streptosporangium sp. NBC_01495 TaxID=2903899 RepID=UPI002E3541FA|nr:hypothetical protein [Streptosporangium sp. NBC_01495]
MNVLRNEPRSERAVLPGPVVLVVLPWTGRVQEIGHPRAVRSADSQPPQGAADQGPTEVALYSTDPETQEFLSGFVNGFDPGYGGSMGRSPQRWRSRFG